MDKRWRLSLEWTPSFALGRISEGRGQPGVSWHGGHSLWDLVAMEVPEERTYSLLSE